MCNIGKHKFIMNSRIYNWITCGLNYAFEFVEQVKKIVSCLIDKSLNFFKNIILLYLNKLWAWKELFAIYFKWTCLSLRIDFIYYKYNWLVKDQSSFVEVRMLELQILSCDNPSLWPKWLCTLHNFKLWPWSWKT